MRRVGNINFEVEGARELRVSRSMMASGELLTMLQKSARNGWAESYVRLNCRPYHVCTNVVVNSSFPIKAHHNMFPFFSKYITMPSRTLLSSCEPEVREVRREWLTVQWYSVIMILQLMHQLDVLISEHQREWEEQMRKNKLQLQLREKELTTLRISLRERTDEVRGCTSVKCTHSHRYCFVWTGGMSAASVTSSGTGTSS